MNLIRESLCCLVKLGFTWLITLLMLPCLNALCTDPTPICNCLDRDIIVPLFETSIEVSLSFITSMVLFFRFLCPSDLLIPMFSPFNLRSHIVLNEFRWMPVSLDTSVKAPWGSLISPLAFDNSSPKAICSWSCE